MNSGISHVKFTELYLEVREKEGRLYTDEEVADLWVAAASAAGVDISRELLEKTVINKFVQAVIRRIATQVSAEMAESIGLPHRQQRS